MQVTQEDEDSLYSHRSRQLSTRHQLCKMTFIPSSKGASKKRFGERGVVKHDASPYLQNPREFKKMQLKTWLDKECQFKILPHRQGGDAPSLSIHDVFGSSYQQDSQPSQQPSKTMFDCMLDSRLLMPSQNSEREAEVVEDEDEAANLQVQETRGMEEGMKELNRTQLL